MASMPCAGDGAGAVAAADQLGGDETRGLRRSAPRRTGCRALGCLLRPARWSFRRRPSSSSSHPNRSSCGRARTDQHFAAGRRLIAGDFAGEAIAGRDDHRHLAGRAHQLASARQTRWRIDHDPRGGARASGTGRQQRVVGCRGAAADHDGIDPAAQLVHDCPRSPRRKSNGCRRGAWPVCHRASWPTWR